MADVKVVAPVPAPVVAPVVVAPEVVAEQAAHAEGLVPMVKEGHVSFVHHMTVAAHEAVGWVKSAFKHI